MKENLLTISYCRAFYKSWNCMVCPNSFDQYLQSTHYFPALGWVLESQRRIWHVTAWWESTGSCIQLNKYLLRKLGNKPLLNHKGCLLRALKTKYPRWVREGLTTLGCDRFAAWRSSFCALTSLCAVSPGLGKIHWEYLPLSPKKENCDVAHLKPSFHPWRLLSFFIFLN